ncbi:hypothetical protein R1sor_002104 [Riccia sorocarpa]|uniref:E3 UFM1-protein ligase 1 homolog n=1 Tax=Riccia sorocarpa TaxID=122646 RepID=A0ABD3H0Z2_9MARC
MDAELLELQKLFQATQESKAKVRLSERNVVELVTKLKNLELLDSDLLHTITGKEFITKERLKAEVEAEINRLGRASLVDIAASVGVELVHCERVAEQIVAEKPDLTFIQGEIVADSYWDTVAEEVNESLQESGQVAVGELAKRFNVGSELITRVLESRIGILIQGKLEGGQLYTPAHVSRIRAVVRGAVRALTVPTPLSAVWSCVQKQLREGDDASSGGVSGEAVLFQSVLSGLISDAEVKGSLRGGGAVWTPAVFAQSQRQSVEAFFSQNGYISYDFLRKLVISQPKTYLQEKYPEGIALETVFIHPSLTSVLDAATEEAISGGGWIDALPLVPTSSSKSDAALLLNLCPSVIKAKKEGTAVVLADTVLVSQAFIKAFSDKVEAEVRQLAEKSVASQLSNPKKSGVDSTGTETAASSSKSGSTPSNKNFEGGDDVSQGKSGKKKKSSANSKERIKDEEDEETGVKGVKGKRKGGRSKGGIGLLIGEAGNGSTKTVKQSVVKEDIDMPTQEQIAEKTLEWFPDMESVGHDGDEYGDGGALAKSLADLVRPIVISTWAAVKRASFTANAEDRRRRLDSLQQRLDEAYSHLQLFEKALDLFEEDSATTLILQRHLLRTSAAEITDMFLKAQNQEKELEEGDGSEGHERSSAASDHLSTGERMSLAKRLRGNALSKRAVELAETLEGKSVEAFETALEAVMEESGLRLKKLDKKSERALLHAQKKLLMAEVAEEEDPVALLPKVVALLFVQVHSRALQAPGRAMAAAVTRLKSGLSEESYQTLMAYHTSTVQLLSMQATSTSDVSSVVDLLLVDYRQFMLNPSFLSRLPGSGLRGAETSVQGADCTNDRMRTKREALIKLMPSLKALAVTSSSVTKD